MENNYIRIKRGGVIIGVNATRSLHKLQNAGIHYHAAVEYHVVERGRFQLFTGTRVYDLEEGMTCIVGPNAFHYLKPYGDCNTEKSEFRFEFLGGKGSGLYVPLPDKEIILFKSVENTLIARRIFEELETRRTGWLEAAQACLELIWISGARHSDVSAKRGAEDNAVLLDDLRGKLISDYFSDNYARQPNPDELAGMLAVSVRQLNRIIKSQLGFSFKQALTKARLEAAKDLLLRGEEPVERISELVGYKSESNFYRIFKRREGVTPSKYRERKTD